VEPDEVRDPAEQLSSLPVHDEPKQQELDTAIQLVGAMATTWKPDQYEDTYTARVEQLIADKREGREVVPPRPPPDQPRPGRRIRIGRRTDEDQRADPLRGQPRRLGHHLTARRVPEQRCPGHCQLIETGQEPPGRGRGREVVHPCHPAAVPGQRHRRLPRPPRAGSAAPATRPPTAPFRRSPPHRCRSRRPEHGARREAGTTGSAAPGHHRRPRPGDGSGRVGAPIRGSPHDAGGAGRACACHGARRAGGAGPGARVGPDCGTRRGAAKSATGRRSRYPGHPACARDARRS
jgi:hypothetical protein